MNNQACYSQYMSKRFSEPQWSVWSRYTEETLPKILGLLSSLRWYSAQIKQVKQVKLNFCQYTCIDLVSCYSHLLSMYCVVGSGTLQLLIELELHAVTTLPCVELTCFIICASTLSLFHAVHVEHTKAEQRNTHSLYSCIQCI